MVEEWFSRPKAQVRFLQPLQPRKARAQKRRAVQRRGTEHMIDAEKKRQSRKSVRQSAWIILDGGFARRPCTVIDLSATGAKIDVDDASAASAGFQLAFSRDARTGRRCQAVWRSGTTLGVRFV